MIWSHVPLTCINTLFFVVAIYVLNPEPVQAQSAGEVLPSRAEGYLDIHHINTGRGDAAFIVMPDGTTMLVDAGDHSQRDHNEFYELMLMDPKPDNSRQPGEWISRYIQRVLSDRPQQKIDYGLITHFHADHMGGIYPGIKTSEKGSYKLTGFTEVHEHIPFSTLIDRAWPDYDYPVPLESEIVDNYRAFINWQKKHSDLQVEQFRPGRNDQITLVNNPDEYPDFEVRNISASGYIWTGVEDNVRNHFPSLEHVQRSDYPSENMCSIVIRMSYGKFDYYTGGDLIGLPSPGSPRWHDVETPVAKAVGPVDVHVLNHHGYHDAANEFFVSALRPRVHIIHAEVASHPGQRVLNRITSQRLYQGPRDIFATNVHPATIATYNNTQNINTPYGHIVIRVDPGGETYRVFIIDDSDEGLRIKALFGPYESD